jgi:hypothetical protein
MKKRSIKKPYAETVPPLIISEALHLMNDKKDLKYHVAGQFAADQLILETALEVNR